MKKPLNITLLLLLVICLFQSCGGEVKKEEVTEEPKEEVTEAPKEEVRRFEESERKKDLKAKFHLKTYIEICNRTEENFYMSAFLDSVGSPETLPCTSTKEWYAYFPKGDFTFRKNKSDDRITGVFEGKYCP